MSLNYSGLWICLGFVICIMFSSKVAIIIKCNVPLLTVLKCYGNRTSSPPPPHQERVRRRRRRRNNPIKRFILGVSTPGASVLCWVSSIRRQRLKYFAVCYRLAMRTASWW